MLPLISEKRIGFNPGYPQQAENPPRILDLLDHSRRQDFIATATSAGGINKPGPGPHKVVAGRIDSCKSSPLGPSSVALSRMSNNSYQPPRAERHMLARKSKVTCLTPSWRLEPSPFHTFLNRTSNRTSHHECSHLLLPAVIPRVSPPALPSEHHRSGLVRPRRRLGRGPAPKESSQCDEVDARDRYWALVAPITLTHRSGTLAHWLSPRLASAFDPVNQSLYSLSLIGPGLPRFQLPTPPCPRT